MCFLAELEHGRKFIKRAENSRRMRVVGVIRKSRRERTSREEFEELLRSAGYEVVEILEQNREEHPRYNIGRGKLEELKSLVGELKPDRVVFANRLTLAKPTTYGGNLRLRLLTAGSLSSRYSRGAPTLGRPSSRWSWHPSSMRFRSSGKR